ncbi:MAG TPA: M23 family metallopeptidase [Flavobacteriales bacterium]|nr:M23 family metallopeptidase [Flavobacteriales bacterium]
MAGRQGVDKAGEKRKRRLLRKLRNKYRLLLINDSTFEERFSMRLTRMNVLLLATGAFIGTALLVGAVILYTPLKRYIPGYSDQETKLNAFRSTVMADSLELQVQARDLYIGNLRRVLRGELPADTATLFNHTELKPRLEDLQPGRSDSLLRARVDGEEAYTLEEGKATSERRELAGVFFFAPIRGIVTSRFDRGQGHYGIDIVTKADAAVKACLPGTVVLASWTTDAGHVLQIQHTNGLTSAYKHNSVLLKKVGDQVKAGEAVAIVGDSGELTSGPHLHFELWLNGEPVDPQGYMVFE